MLVACIVRKQVMHRQHNLRSAPPAELHKPQVHRGRRPQHGQVLHMNHIRWRNGKPHRQRAQVQHGLQQLQNPARQPCQTDLPHHIQQPRIDLDAATGKTIRIEIISNRSHRQVDRLPQQRLREIGRVVGHRRQQVHHEDPGAPSARAHFALPFRVAVGSPLPLPYLIAAMASWYTRR